MQVQQSPIGVPEMLRFSPMQTELAKYTTASQTVQSSSGSGLITANLSNMKFTIPREDQAALLPDKFMSGIIVLTTPATLPVAGALYFRSSARAVIQSTQFSMGQVSYNVQNPWVFNEVYKRMNKSSLYATAGDLSSFDFTRNIGISVSSAVNGTYDSTSPTYAAPAALATGTTYYIPFTIPLDIDPLTAAADYVPLIKQITYTFKMAALDDLFTFVDATGNIIDTAIAGTGYSLGYSNLEINYRTISIPDPTLWSQIILSQALSSGNVVNIKTSLYGFESVGTISASANAASLVIPTGDISSMKQICLIFNPQNVPTANIAQSVQPNLTFLQLSNGATRMFPTQPLNPSISNAAYSESLRAVNRLGAADMGCMPFQVWFKSVTAVAGTGGNIPYSAITAAISSGSSWVLMLDLEKVDDNPEGEADKQNSHSGVFFSGSNNLLTMRFSGLTGNVDVYAAYIYDGILECDLNQNDYFLRW